MKVILLNDSFPPVIDGVANAVVNYASILTSTKRADVMVGTPAYPGTDYSVYPYSVIAYQSFHTPDFTAGYRAGNPFVIKSVSKMAKFSPDIIHVHCPAASAILGRILRKETGAPIVFTYHTKYDLDIARAVKSEHLRKEAVKVMIDNISACDEVWTVSHGAGESLRALGYEGDIRVVSNGVDFEKGQADAALVEEAVKGFDLPEDVPMFLFVGRLINYKGLPLILDAMRQLSADGIDYRMVFVGSGADKEGLEQTVREYGISLSIRQEDGTITDETGSSKAGRVIFTGPVYDRNILRAWNTRADLFLFPSTYDTNGIVVREAAACGLASVLIEGSCAAEGITHGRNGFLMQENADSLAALLRELAPQRDTMKQVGQKAMDEIYISWEESVLAAADRYQVILERRHAEHRAGTERTELSSDRFIGTTVDVMDALYDAFHLPKAVHTGIQDNLNGSYQYMKDNLIGMQENVADASEYLKEKYQDFLVRTREIGEGFRDIGEGFHSAGHEVKEGFKEGWKKITGGKD
ncbi:MAG: glycosyltransferase [Oscillospiraceae bacterium]|nr:glycosyltransferase [Oscillospiraceae bacterium]